MIQMTMAEFRQLAEYIEAHYGIHLKDEKQTMLMGRLNAIVGQMGFDNFTQYFKTIMEDKSGEGVVRLIDKITTNHTFFMREEEHFTFLKEKVLPQMSIAIKDMDLRTWCAASSSGEESHTLAMIIDEYFYREKLCWDTKVLATDISSAVLETAVEGIYSNDKLEPLPAYYKQTYFKRVDKNSMQVTDRIRNEVIYRKFNLMEPIFPFKKKFHIIFCRNVMIYFNQETKDQLIEKFYNQLEDGGYLFIGHSETVNRNKSRFKYICPAIYRK